MPSTTAFEFGDVVLVPFPFTDQTASKKRPAVVISSATYHRERPDILFMAITSQVRATTAFGEVRLTGWREAGLLKVSVVKPVIATVAKDLVVRNLGRLSEKDRRGLEEVLRSILGE